MGQLVVVVEDDTDTLGMMREALELDGYEVIPITHPCELGSLQPGIYPDLFLIDVLLPHWSGIEVAQELRRRGFDTSPMIAMSASRLLAGAASEAGVFTEVLDKPFDLTELLECVQLHAGGPTVGTG